jgi:hypothetical protein
MPSLVKNHLTPFTPEIFFACKSATEEPPNRCFSDTPKGKYCDLAGSESRPSRHFWGLVLGKEGLVQAGNFAKFCPKFGEALLICRIWRQLPRERFIKLGSAGQRSGSIDQEATHLLGRLIYIRDDVFPPIDHRDEIFEVLTSIIVALPTIQKGDVLGRKKRGGRYEF